MKFTAICPRRPAALLALAACLLPAVPCPAAAERAYLLDTAGRILAEEERQLRAGRALGDTAARLLELAADLESNELPERERIAEFAGLAGALAAVNTGSVAMIVGDLRGARADPAAAGPHLESALARILEVIRELESMVAVSAAEELERLLIAELNALIAAQDRIAGESRDLGRLFLQEGERRPSRLLNLADNQAEASRRAEWIEETLRRRKDAETDPDKRALFEKALDIAESERIAQLLRDAAASLQREYFVAAVRNQSDALEALRAIRAILVPQESPPHWMIVADALETLSDILDQQRELRSETAEIEPRDFAQAWEDLQTRQNGLASQLEPLAPPPDGPDPGGAALNILTAIRAMREAAGLIEAAGLQAPAPEIAPSVMYRLYNAAVDDAQQRAEAALLAALGDSGDPETPVAAMPFAAEEDAAAAAGEAEDHAAAGMEPGPPGPPGEGIGFDPGMMEGEGQGLGPGAGDGLLPGAGLSVFEAVAPAGTRPASGRAAAEHLSDRELDVMNRGFARELPLEFRDLLQAYYESLAGTEEPP